MAGGYDHSVGLRADGTVVTAGYTDPEQYDIESWTDMKVPQKQQ